MFVNEPERDPDELTHLAQRRHGRLVPGRSGLDERVPVCAWRPAASCARASAAVPDVYASRWP